MNTWKCISVVLPAYGHTWAGFTFPTFSYLKVEALLWTSFFGPLWGWRRRAGAEGRCEVSLGWTGCLCLPRTQTGYRESTSLGIDNKFGESKLLCVSIVGEIISSPIKTFPALERDQDFTSLSCCVPLCIFYIMPLVPRVPWTHSRPSQWESLVWKVTCKCKTSLLACL